MKDLIEFSEASYREIPTSRQPRFEGDRRFADPLIIQIVETWRLRQDMVRAQSRLSLQAQAVLRRLCGGSKEEATKLYGAIGKGYDGPEALAVAPLLMARDPLERNLASRFRSIRSRNPSRVSVRLPSQRLSLSAVIFRPTRPLRACGSGLDLLSSMVVVNVVWRVKPH
jgi:hypothetical protein